MSWGIDVNSEMELILDSWHVKGSFAFLWFQSMHLQEDSLVVATSQASHLLLLLLLLLSESTFQAKLAVWKGGIPTGCRLALEIFQLEVTIFVR